MSSLIAQLISLFLRFLSYVELIIRASWFLLKLILFLPYKLVLLVFRFIKWLFSPKKEKKVD